MDQNLAWTSALGDANASQPQAVLNAIQAMRRRAQQAGNLKSTSQQTVTTEGQTVVIQPANPEVVYVPEYDPWIVYGAPVGVYPYWDPYPGLYLDGPGFAFGLGIGIGTLRRIWLGVGPLGRRLAWRQGALQPSRLHRPRRGLRAWFQSRICRFRPRRRISRRRISCGDQRAGSMAARSTASVVPAPRGRFPRADGRVSAAGSMVAGSMVADSTGRLPWWRLMAAGTGSANPSRQNHSRQDTGVA